jgi:hypothetical protein
MMLEGGSKIIPAYAGRVILTKHWELNKGACIDVLAKNLRALWSRDRKRDSVPETAGFLRWKHEDMSSFRVDCHSHWVIWNSNKT